jgi:molybdenum cofactor cytidylyltransferase
LDELNGISAIILASGLSTRMGRPKLLLPWKDQTILGEVTSKLNNAGVQEIVIVIQARQQQLLDHIQQLSRNFPLRIAYNNSFEPEDMLSSIRCGLKALDPSINATLITLGDQPQIQEGIVQQICSAYSKSRAMLVIPSYRMRRGHPWLISQSLWPQLIRLESPFTPHDFLEQYKEEILYVNVDNPSILQDIDTPEDYEMWKP